MAGTNRLALPEVQACGAAPFHSHQGREQQNGGACVLRTRALADPWVQRTHTHTQLSVGLRGF